MYKYMYASFYVYFISFDYVINILVFQFSKSLSFLNFLNDF